MVHRKGKRVQTLATRFIARFNRCWLAEATTDDHVKERRHGGFNCSELVKIEVPYDTLVLQRFAQR